jgi:hypothetical protein
VRHVPGALRNVPALRYSFCAHAPGEGRPDRPRFGGDGHSRRGAAFAPPLARAEASLADMRRAGDQPGGPLRAAYAIKGLKISRRHLRHAGLEISTFS